VTPADAPGRKRQLLVLSVGVSDAALQRIGLVMVSGAQLDHRRMTLLHTAAEVPVSDSAMWRRARLTRELKKTYAEEPLNRLLPRLTDWLVEVNALLDIRDRYAHSITYYQVDGLGNAGSFSLHPKTGDVLPVVDEPELDEEILGFAEAGDRGAQLEIEAGILLDGGAAAHDRVLDRRRDFDRRTAAMRAETAALMAEADSPEDDG
jgi:hypothetical protein